MTLSLAQAQQLDIIFSGVMPLPPGINQSYKVVCVRTRRGIVHRIGPTPELEQFKLDAAKSLHKSYQDNYALLSNICNLQAMRKKTPLTVVLTFYFPTMWKRDVDGGIKAAMDAAFEKIGLNDNLVVEVVTKKRVDASNPRCEIVVMLASGAA